ncbi:MAG: 16S rRNA (cytosine(1402)-N(4))-methyltransferase RsmH [Calditrichota bacterium]
MSEVKDLYHTPVLATKVIELLLENKGHIFIDATVGYGSHAIQLLDKAGPDIQLYALDRDPQALLQAQAHLSKYNNIFYQVGSFSELKRHTATWNITEADGILADLGPGSHQLDDASRGFTHRFSGDLDMRYNPEQNLTAENIINEWSYEELTNLFQRIGEERRAAVVAREVTRRRPLKTTADLAAIVRRCCSGPHVEKSLARIFMSLRVAVNDELNMIEAFLPAAASLLKTGGRLVVIAFDSHQDRLVKEFFRRQSLNCVCPPRLPMCVCNVKPALKVITRKTVRPDAQEILTNPRSRSARLRCAEKIV